jgi:hypothetical protein
MGKAMIDSRVYLSYDNFRRLDIVTRIETGRPLVVYDQETYEILFPECWPLRGVVGAFDGLVFNIPSTDGYISKSMTNIPAVVNIIDPQEGEVTGPHWLDREQIPKELLFDFTVHHEIAHIKHGDNGLLRYWSEKGLYTVDQLRVACMLNKADTFEKAGEAIHYKGLIEYRADRYAWSKLFPGKDMPGKYTPEYPKDRIDKAIKQIQNLCCVHDADLERFKLQKVEPISLHPEEFIPDIHQQLGVPLFEFKYSCGPARKSLLDYFKSNFKSILSKRPAWRFCRGYENK